MRTRLALVVPLALLAASCSSSGDDGKQSLEPTSSPTPAVTQPATSGSGSPGTIAGPAATATGQATAGTSTRTPSTVAPASSAPLSTRAPGTTAASKATRPGTYTYTSSGKVTVGATPQDASGEQTLTISPLRNGIQHSTLHAEQSGDTEQDIVVRDTGSYAASLKLTYGQGAIVKEFRPDPAVLLMPDPAVVGKAWGWSARSTDGKTSVQASNKLVRRETLTIGGAKVATFVLQTHLVITGDLDYTADVSVWWAPEQRLPVKQRTVGKGSYGGFPFSTDVTAVMTSVDPR